MIISASRRTDLPGFYWDWFLQRIREKFLITVNPLYKKQWSLVSLDPREVDAIVFWTKNPAPCLDSLSELEEAGFQGRLFFQVTINPYGDTPLEENLPPLSERIGALRALAGRIGPDHIVYRYDPILLTRGSLSIDTRFHQSQFRSILTQVGSCCSRVVTSVISEYRKSRVNFRRLKDELDLEVTAPDPVALSELARFMVEEARKQGLTVYSCAEGGERRDVLKSAGVFPGSCIDLEFIEQHLPTPVTLPGKQKDPGQRLECGCMKSRDIGAYHTCLARCQYCYATDFRKTPQPVDPERALSLEPIRPDEELVRHIEQFRTGRSR